MALSSCPNWDLQQAQEAATPIAWLDVTALVILGVFLLIGLVRGLFWSLSRLLALAAAFVVASLFSASIADRIRSWFSEAVRPTELPEHVAWFALFLFVVSCASLLVLVAERVVQSDPEDKPRFQSRLTGGVLGATTGGAVVFLLVAAITLFVPATLGAENRVVRAAETSRSMACGRWVVALLDEIVPLTLRSAYQPPVESRPQPQAPKRR
jgi:uncharacterized membrane protein required for colicin V production